MSLWSHDVLLAVVLTVLAVSFIGVAMTGGPRHDATMSGATSISRN